MIEKIIEYSARNAFVVILVYAIIIVWGIFVTQQTVWQTPGHWIEKGILLTGGIVFSMGGYFLIHAMIKTEEFFFLMGLIKGKLWRVRSSTENQ